MSKKKNKVPKITEEEYFAYIAGLKTETAPVTSDGKLLVPPPFSSHDADTETNDSN